jgi:hypothetical protein
MAAKGLGVMAMRTRLHSEGISSPREGFGTHVCYALW